jgi:DNA-binding NarL/FixJ family response regulator
MKRPRALLAEDHSTVAEQLRTVLEQDCEIVGIVGDGHALLEAARTLRPDVIVADITMPGIDGIEAAAKIVQLQPHIRVVIITVHNDPALVQRAISAGASGYVLKLSAGEDLPLAIQAVLRGELFISPQARRQFLAGKA